MEGGWQTRLMLMSSSGFQIFAATSADGFTLSPPYSLTGNSTAPASLRTTVFGGRLFTRSGSGFTPRPGPQYPDSSGTFCCAAPADAVRRRATSTATVRLIAFLRWGRCPEPQPELRVRCHRHG